MIFVLIGAPGAGKGTQGDLLQSKCGFKKISTGDALRRQIKLGTTVGRNAEAIMARGELVPDSVLEEVLKVEIEACHGGGNIVLDGYPRNLAQAKTLEDLSSVHRVVSCMHLDVKRELLVSRLTGRRVCESCGSSFHIEFAPSRVDGICDKCGSGLIQRADDGLDSVYVRLDVFDNNTRPVIDFYRCRQLYCKVNGMGNPPEIFDEICDIISSFRSA